MISGLQNTFIEEMSKSGCYFLCICELAERITGKRVDVLNTALYAFEENWMWRDFTVQRPDLILADLIGKKVKVEASNKLPTTCKYYVEKWFNPRTGFSHFRLHDWDSLTNSVTVKEGKIDSYRIFIVDEK